MKREQNIPPQPATPQPATSKTTAPKFGSWLLSRIINPEIRYSALGDFDEIFEELVKTDGLTTAHLWYWSQIVKSLPPFIFDSIYWSLVMLKNYLKTAFRNLHRHKGYAFINISGLALGIACCFLILLYVQDERSYDRYHKNADEIYRLLTERPGRGLRAKTEYLLGPTLKKEFPFVEQSVRFSRPQTVFITYEEKVFTEERVFYTDPTAFDLFSFPLLRGNPETVLHAPNAVVITEAIARKYFGNEDPIGKKLIFNQANEMVVTGVATNVPLNSHFRFDFLAPLSVYLANWGPRLEQWTTSEIYTYIQLSDKQATATLESQFPDFIERYIGQGASSNQIYHLQPLTDIHLYSAGVFWEIVPQGDIRYVYIFSTIAFLILMIACINFINLSTANSSKRSKEVGLRKVVGAYRFQLIKQFLGESFLMSFIALLVGIVLISWALPTLNGLTGKAFDMNDVNAHWINLIGLVVFVGLLAGSYPAFALSGFQPAIVLKSKLHGNSKRVSLRNILVVFQFATTGILIFGSLIVYKQLDYMKNKELGFEKEQKIVITLPGMAIGNYLSYKNEIIEHSGITTVSASSNVPPATWGYPRLQPKGSDSTFSAKLFAVDFDLIEVLGLEMLTGRSFSRDFTTDSSAMILNETAVRMLGQNNTSILGEQISVSWINKEGPVIGVVKDFHFRSLRMQIQPVVFTIAPPNRFLFNIVAKIRAENPSKTVAFLKETWQKLMPEWPFEYRFLDQQLDEQYRTDEQLGALVGYLSIISIFLACLGLLGLAAFIAEQRTKEIGIRKVFGASVPGIVLLLSKDFAKLIIAAFIFAVPLAYLTANRWLEEFVYRIEIGPNIFLLTGLFILIIALLSVSYQSIKAAMADPVKTLRYE